MLDEILFAIILLTFVEALWQRRRDASMPQTHQYYSHREKVTAIKRQMVVLVI